MRKNLQSIYDLEKRYLGENCGTSWEFICISYLPRDNYSKIYEYKYKLLNKISTLARIKYLKE